MEKKAINLQPGDHVLSPINALSGEVKATIVVDAGVQVHFVGGGHIVRPEDDLLEVMDA